MHSKTVEAIVCKGCPQLGLSKGLKGNLTLTVNGEGRERYIRATFTPYTGETRYLWLSGNRVRIPDLTVKNTLRAHRGDPTRYVDFMVTQPLSQPVTPQTASG